MGLPIHTFMVDVMQLATLKLLPAQRKWLAPTRYLWLHTSPDQIAGYEILGEAFWPDCGIPDRVELYSLGISLAYAGRRGIIPYGRLIAFTTIHECAHLLAPGGHNVQGWEDACRVMGINERCYNSKGKNWLYLYEFHDLELWGQIRQLPSYPYYPIGVGY